MPSSRIHPRANHFRVAATLCATLLLAACSGSGGSGDTLNPPPGGDYEILLGGVGTLVEGDGQPLFVPIELDRRNGHTRPVTLSLATDDQDARNLSASVVDAVFEGDERDSGVLLSLAIDTLPLMPERRRITLIASDGETEDRLGVEIDVRPTSAPDVYLLVGQSNMVGFSGEGTREAWPGGADETDPRIRQLNVSGNDGFGTFARARDYVSVERNVLEPRLVIAEDPLHLPRSAVAANGSENGKEDSYIGLGLSFAKRAAFETTADIVLVPGAWSGSSFCANGNGPGGNWNAGPVDSAALGNTLLFDRALTRADVALETSGGVLRGILWHQGESDANERCAPLYAENLDRLVRELRTRIRVDARGPAARGADAPIPVVVGTLSRGADEREDLSLFSPAKRQIDDALRAIPGRLSWVAVSNHDDLVPSNGYACGSGSCIHFGAAALREMGARYHAALQRAAQSGPNGAN